MFDREGPQAIDAVDDVLPFYDALFCDVWGVLHDGVRKSVEAEAALIRARSAGLAVVLVTNSPRRADGVRRQLDGLAVSPEAYDGIATSGDATRALIEAGPPRVFHLGPPRDGELFDGLAVRRVGEGEAEAVIATGLFDDERETPDDYAERLAAFAERGLPMVCANPDVVVHRGGRLIFCAGALAQSYAALGGSVHFAGKPHAAIYEVARALLPPTATRVLAVGDGLATDILGAENAGLDALFVVHGIHGEEFGPMGDDPGRITAALAARNLAARYFIPALR